MSVRCIQAVFDHSPHRGATRLVQLALADYAHDDGIAFPSVEGLAKKTLLSVRSVHYALLSLSKSGDVVIQSGAGPRGTNLYQLLARVDSTSPAERPEDMQTPANLAPLQPLQGANDDVEGCKPGHEPPARVAPEPSIEPSLEPVDKSSSEPSDEADDAGPERQVFEYFKQEIQPQARVFPKKKISSRLKSFTAAELMAGIDNFAANPWWMENNGHRGATWFFDKDSRSEQFLNLPPPRRQTQLSTAPPVAEQYSPGTEDLLAGLELEEYAEVA